MPPVYAEPAIRGKGAAGATEKGKGAAGATENVKGGSRDGRDGRG